MTIRLSGQVDRLGSDRLIHNETLVTAGRFDVQNSIINGYAFIELLLISRSDVVALFDLLFLLFNNDSTAANYRRSILESGPGTSATNASTPAIDETTAASSTADYFGMSRIIIPNYDSTTITKQARTIGHHRRDATVNLNTDGSIHWENTAAITRLQLQPDGYSTDEFIAGSSLRIWLRNKLNGR